MPVQRTLARVAVTAITTATALALAACTSTNPARLISGPHEPFRVAGLPVHDGPSGLRPNTATPSGHIENTDHGQSDTLALLSINDIAQYWTQAYPATLSGTFTAITNLLSYDSRDRRGPWACGDPTYRQVNAFYCLPDQLIGWDRGVLLPAVEKYYGQTTVAALLAHEYGHAVQQMAHLIIKDQTPTLVAEQQADCFAGKGRQCPLR